MKDIPSYPKIWNLGNRAITDLFKGEVEITEKVDGSQFGFGVTASGEIVMRSKGVQLYNKEQNNMFAEAIAQVERVADTLRRWNTVEQFRQFYNGQGQSVFFYGEYLRKPKHNCLAYKRVPKNNIIIFALKIGENFIDNYDTVKLWAETLDFETVPLLHRGPWESDRVIKSEAGNVNQVKKFGYTGYERLQAMIHKTMSCLSDEQTIEGVVIKNYNQLTSIGPPGPCFGKFVRESFKEKLHRDWGSISGKNKLQLYIDGFRSEARWAKAVQHLKERGELEYAPQDIGKLMKEIHEDILREEGEEIKTFLYKHYIGDIKRKACAGVPEWYKNKLMEKQFTQGE